MFLIFKIILIFVVIGISTYLGILFSNKYHFRVKELQEIISGIEIFETRIKYTQDDIVECFKTIASFLNSKASRIFSKAAEKISSNINKSTGDCFRESIDEEKILLSINEDDIEVLKGLSVSLGQTDLDNQIKNIRLTIQNLNIQLEMAKLQKNKNHKLCRNMGALVGIVIAIILV